MYVREKPGIQEGDRTEQSSKFFPRGLDFLFSLSSRVERRCARGDCTSTNTVSDVIHQHLYPVAQNPVLLQRSSISYHIQRLLPPENPGHLTHSATKRRTVAADTGKGGRDGVWLRVGARVTALLYFFWYFFADIAAMGFTRSSRSRSRIDQPIVEHPG